LRCPGTFGPHFHCATCHWPKLDPSGRPTSSPVGAGPYQVSAEEPRPHAGRRGHRGKRLSVRPRRLIRKQVVRRVGASAIDFLSAPTVQPLNIYVFDPMVPRGLLTPISACCSYGPHFVQRHRVSPADSRARNGKPKRSAGASLLEVRSASANRGISIANEVAGLSS